jgi:hypothetical protein
MREQMAQHRANPVCASCHAQMDQLGFALENFDAIGEWRDADASGVPIDASGELADGTKVDGVVTLRNALLSRPDVFVGTMTEKLLTYALGRGSSTRMRQRSPNQLMRKSRTTASSLIPKTSKARRFK